MSGCPFHNTPIKEGLPPLIPRIARLPRDERGYPIPFFVGYVDDKPEFRLADRRKWQRCHRERLCWVCGQTLGKYVTFSLGPMCTISRTTAEPPSHNECALWSVKGCPFLSNPEMKRPGEIDRTNVAGHMIERNPGVTALWTVLTTPVNPKGYILFPDGEGRALIEVSNPHEVTWWRKGEPATRNEVVRAIESGLPILQEQCDKEPLATERDAAHMELVTKTAVAMKYIPAEEEKRRIITPWF